MTATSDLTALSTSGLTRRFGKRVAVDSLSLQVGQGDVYGFLGPNGAGKTTAIRCILGLIRRDAGQVSIFGETDPVRQRRHVGAMVETPAFHTWMSARENLRRSLAFAGGNASDAAAIDAALDRVGLAGRERDKVGSYSLGMKQRLGIARALLDRPKLLVLDEPTNGLDPRGMKEVRDLLADLARRERLTIFISSHLLHEVEQLCNRVGIIEKGRLIAEGTPGELSSRGTAAEVDVGATDLAALGRVVDTLGGVTVVGDAGGGRARVRLGGLSVGALNRALVQAGVEVTSLVPVEHRLEDLFLSLTSEELS